MFHNQLLSTVTNQQVQLRQHRGTQERSQEAIPTSIQTINHPQDQLQHTLGLPQTLHLLLKPQTAQSRILRKCATSSLAASHSNPLAALWSEKTVRDSNSFPPIEDLFSGIPVTLFHCVVPKPASKPAPPRTTDSNLDFTRTKSGHLLPSGRTYKPISRGRGRGRGRARGRGRGGPGNMTLNNSRRPYQSVISLDSDHLRDLMHIYRAGRASKRKYLDKPCPRFTTTGTQALRLILPFDPFQ